jgi:hypothetical protein
MDLSGEHEPHIDIFNTVTSGCAENVEKSRVLKGNTQLEAVFNKAMDVADLGGRNQLVIVEGEQNKSFACMNILAGNADKFGRSASLGAVLEMPSKNANELKQLIENDPGVFFRAVKKANGGNPILTYSPTGSKNAEVILSSSIEILPDISFLDTRSSYQGKISQKRLSTAFPPGYKPW